MTKEQITELKNTDMSKGITLDKYMDEEIYTEKKKLILKKQRKKK